MDAYLNGKKLSLNPSQIIGRGGEAEIYDIGGLVVKLYKEPNHPDYQPEEQQPVKDRLAAIQHKLRDFPHNLPSEVVAPQDIVTDKSGHKIVGYIMSRVPHGSEVLLRYAEKVFRQLIPNRTVIEIFKNLHRVVTGIHKATVTIGDFNDLNILVIGNTVYIVDADSMQFGKYLCRMFTAKFVDPILCDQFAPSPMIIKPHNENSDWYAYSIMLFQCLLYVDPYGGIYKPKNKADRIPHTQRPLHRISVFNPEVVYPKPAVHYSILPDDVLQYYHQLLGKDMRDIFPSRLLDMQWTICKCGITHARHNCPSCQKEAPGIVKQIIRIHGKVKCTTVLLTKGIILHTTTTSGKIACIYNEDSQFKREDGSTIMHGDPTIQVRYRIRGNDTCIAKGNLIAIFTKGADGKHHELTKYATDYIGHLPIFDTNDNHIYRIVSGLLVRGDAVDVPIGTVLSRQTYIWSGPTFGFGFYRVGDNTTTAFIFDAIKNGINDTIKVHVAGALIDATCYFSTTLCWFFYQSKQGSRIISTCTVIKRNGEVNASYSAEQGSEPWLDNLRGKTAYSSFLLVATDDGLRRYEVINNIIQPTKEYPDTEPFMTSDDKLVLGKDGLYVASAHDIKLIQLG